MLLHMLLLGMGMGAAAVASPFAIEGSDGGCWDFPSVRAIPHGLFQMRDTSSFHAPIILSTPGTAVSAAAALHPPQDPKNYSCTGFTAGRDTGCPAFMYAGACWCLGNSSGVPVATLLDPANASAGVSLYYGGGVGGAGCSWRGTRYRIVCDPTAAAGAGPSTVDEHTPATCDITINWPSAAACDAVPSPQSCPTPPLPTADQLMYHRMEVGALISFNMATAAGSQGCGPGAYPPAAAFNGHVPPQANTDQWCAAIASFGGKWATLVAKHECGFALWPTKASSGNFTYDYQVPDGVDYVRQVAESCAAVGIKLGVYYSVNANSYLGVWANGVSGSKVSQAQYDDIVLQQLGELWGNYGSLAESESLSLSFLVQDIHKTLCMEYVFTACLAFANRLAAC
eukprot:SAG31_NODE_148_length_22511_cov_20.369266_18_plen_398_part_00